MTITPCIHNVNTKNGSWLQVNPLGAKSSTNYLQAPSLDQLGGTKLLYFRSDYIKYTFSFKSI